MTESPPELFDCFFVQQKEEGARGAVCQITPSQLPAGQVLLEIHWSSLNYKDALAATGNPGVAPQLPHIPGIDAAGVVRHSEDPRYQPGDQVLVTGYGLGSTAWGGWSQYQSIPGDWVVPLPEGLSLREAMVLGTAGFTAAQAVLALQQNGVAPDDGEVVVTGATGGVGSLAVMLLAKLGYHVVAVTGKQNQHASLLKWGAERIISREEVTADRSRPLLKSTWAGAIDTVGGTILETLLRQTSHRGTVAACGLVGGTDLVTTVYPFILRGITLAGIDSAKCPAEPRQEIWNHLAGPWRIDDLESLATEIQLTDLPKAIETILAGKVVGRTVVNLRPPNTSPPV